MPRTVPEEEHAAVAALARWVQGRGLEGYGSDGCVVVAEFPETGRGLAAARDLVRGEPFLRVPASCLLANPMPGHADPLPGAAGGTWPAGLRPEHRLAVRLLYERGRGRVSPWAPYVAACPAQYATLADFDAGAVDALQVPAMRARAERARESAREAHASLAGVLEAVAPPSERTLEAFLWACGTVASRTCSVPWCRAGALVPVGDLVNHRPREGEGGEEGEGEGEGEGEEAFVPPPSLDPDGAFFTFRALRAYARGEEVCVTYGAHKNADLLEYYGFAADPGANPDDWVAVPLPPADGRSPAAAASLRAVEASAGARGPRCVRADGSASFALACALRTWFATGERGAQVFLAEAGMPVSEASESRALAHVAACCKAAVAALPTTADEDAAWLADTYARGIARNRRNTHADGWHEPEEHVHVRGPQGNGDGDSDSAGDGAGAGGHASALAVSCEVQAVRWRLAYKRLLLAAASRADQGTCFPDPHRH